MVVITLVCRNFCRFGCNLRSTDCSSDRGLVDVVGGFEIILPILRSCISYGLLVDEEALIISKADLDYLIALNADLLWVFLVILLYPHILMYLKYFSYW